MKHIAVFASGSGSNAENLYRFFENHPDGNVVLILSDRKDAFVLQRMAAHGVDARYMTPAAFGDGTVASLLREKKIDLVVLAGFLRLVPANLVEAYRNRIVNIHPALLPKFGGKGMYGMHVHRAVVEAGEHKTGITVHQVNERFDEGTVVARYETEIAPGDTPEDVASKIHELEMKWFPKVVEQILRKIPES